MWRKIKRWFGISEEAARRDAEASWVAENQISVDQATSAAFAADQAYRLQLAQFKVEQNSAALLSKLLNETCRDSRALLAEIRALQAHLAQKIPQQ
jgi:hypothetical protein